MSTRIQQFQILQNQPYQQQLASCLLFAAINVLNEAATTTNHANRIVWANAIVINPMAQALTVLNYTMSNPTIATNAGNVLASSLTPYLDTDIDFVVASLFDKFATAFVATR